MEEGTTFGVCGSNMGREKSVCDPVAFGRCFSGLVPVGDAVALLANEDDVAIFGNDDGQDVG